MDPIYLDYNATTPLAEEVIEAMRPWLEGGFGNPSSNHAYGKAAAEVVVTARQQVADLLGASPDEIVFTGGGSESNNHAIRGATMRTGTGRDQIVTSAVEHPAVLEVCRYVANQGRRVSVLGVDETGRIDPEDVARVAGDSTALVTVMHANNEVGTIQPIAELSSIAHRCGALMHTDAAQSIGKIPVKVDQLGVDLLTLAGHKLYGPKGVGALYIRRGTKIERFIHGADHEQGRRAGTENVLGIVGLGKACELANAQLASRAQHLERLRDLLYDALGERIPNLQRNGHPMHCLPNTLSVSFTGVVAGDLLGRAAGVAASAGAACHSGEANVSGTLRAMGVSDQQALGTIRFSTGSMLTAPEVTRAAEIIANAYESMLNATR